MNVAERRSSSVERFLAIARRDAAIELSYHFALIARTGGIAITVCTFYFIGRIVDPTRLGEYDGRYFEFVLVGLLVAAISSVGLGSFTQAIRAEQSNGTLEVLLATPTSLPTLFAGTLVVPMVLAFVETMLVFVIAILAGADFATGGALTVALAIPPTLAVYAAFGALSAAFVVLSKRGDPVTPMITGITNFLAGALFPIAVMPPALQAVAHLLPPFYALEVLRAGLLNGESITDVALEYSILVMFAVVLLPLGLAVLFKSLRAARVAGTLGSY